MIPEGIIWGIKRKKVPSFLLENRLYIFEAKIAFTKKISKFVLFGTSVPYGHPKHPPKKFELSTYSQFSVLTSPIFSLFSKSSGFLDNDSCQVYTTIELKNFLVFLGYPQGTQIPKWTKFTTFFELDICPKIAKSVFLQKARDFFSFYTPNDTSPIKVYWGMQHVF